MNGFDADDYVVGGKWRGRADRDYVPPGGMRKYPEDDIARSGGGLDNVVVPVAHVSLPVIPALAPEAVPDDWGKGSVVQVSDEVRGAAARYLYKSGGNDDEKKKAARKLRGAMKEDPTSGIRCPVCGGDDLGCVDSRVITGGGRRRRYKCRKEGCSGKVTTIERAE